MMKMRINHNLQCEIDSKKDDCNREAAHCHVTRNGRRVAQVWLYPVCIESGHDLNRNEVRVVYDFVCDNAYALAEEYEYNREHGAE